MIELIIAACLSQGRCEDFVRSYPVSEMSLMTCMMGAPIHVARWQSEHPDWHVVRWRCGTAEDGQDI